MISRLVVGVVVKINGGADGAGRGRCGIHICVDSRNGSWVRTLASFAVLQKASNNNGKNKGQKKNQVFKGNLECRPWCTDNALESSTTDSDSSDSSDSDSVEGPRTNDDEEMQQHTALSVLQKDGSACALCTKEYRPGEPVYTSNNPKCGHEFHKVCMDKWLNIQNTCAICNQAYVLRTV